MSMEADKSVVGFINVFIPKVDLIDQKAESAE